MPVVNGRRLTGPFACAIAVAAVAGCAGGAEPAKPAASMERGVTPRPRVTKHAMEKWLLDVAQHRLCAPTRRLMHPLYGTITASDCEATRSRLRGAVAANARSYGTAMVIDFRTAAGAHRSAVMALDGTLVYRLLFVLDTKRATVNTTAATGAAATARRAISSLTLGDCDGFLSAASRQFGVGDGKREEVCARLPKLGLTRAMMAHPAGRLDPYGGNWLLVFYGLRLAPGSYYTIVMARSAKPDGTLTSPPGYKFVTAASSGTSKT